MKGFSEVSMMDMEKIDGGFFAVSDGNGGTITMVNSGGNSNIVHYNSQSQVIGQSTGGKPWVGN